MTLDDFYRSELWEVVDLINVGSKKEDNDVKREFVIGRMIMSAMTDVSKMVFDWEKKQKTEDHKVENWSLERQENLKSVLAKMDKKHIDKLNGIRN